MASHTWAALLLIVAAGGCSGSTSTVVIESNGDGIVEITGNHPPIEGEIHDGELHGITPTPAPITPVSAMETPIPTPTPRLR